ncbi:hypothetical protein Tco_1433312 [Tanacetum coccineum]
MNMYPSQVSPPRTPGSNEYVPLAGVPSKNTGHRGGGGCEVVARMTGVMWWWEWCRGDGDEGGVRMMVVVVR